ncbi:MAG: arsenate reductase (glutaredoxin) [Arcobacter sp.]|jgi:arsenate reductase|uniref:Arsenate reductase (ArsC) family protein n=1 Tax=Arcobacter defluvii TaxID=873191 RepID=A0AAE7BD60_9BACT|nr:MULTISPECIES: arsenate reductase (glutaredoxin) [Arcobacter]MDY3200062.1 arsenate reductase (glutaredoxin) [Arcobacter sp.]QKF77250.1 arsenate reductase (ArsC) family protein [Arcobacter defluvii]RXI33461.1 arsenate reductase (glutaredoxin) [Arcobacter defluvii]BAK73131.1 arsenate reductase [Arcobacter sp. L]
MQNIQIWHNPKCSKSRNAMTLLEEKGINANIVKYLETSPSKEQLKDVLKKLNMKASELLRTGEDIYKELNLKNVIDEEQLIEIMVEHPILIERPIIIKGDKAVIARPIEKLEELLK